jgi:membrane-bound ClpP family serine protease
LLGAILLSASLAASPQLEPVVEVIEVTGYVDNATLAYLRDSIAEAAAANRELAIIQLDARAVVGSGEDVAATAALLAAPPLPVVVWIGPAPATATGALEELAASAPRSFTADEAPSIRQLVQGLDGVAVREGDPPLRTITAELPTGEEGITTVPVIFTQPGLLHRFLHLGASPEAAFFFLVGGLTVVAFEYFSLGPGLAAAVGGLSLLLASYGIAVLPVRPLALAGAVLSIFLFAVSHQRGGVFVLNLVATGLLAWSGLSFTADPTLVPISGLGALSAILGVLFFFLLAIPTVGRARLSTPTIGRQTLIGQEGIARIDLTPDGSVEVKGAQWPATAHRQAAIRAGDPVVVTAVAGRELMVERLNREI